MNTKIVVMISLFMSLFLLFSFQTKRTDSFLNNQENPYGEKSKDTILIQGRITVKGSDKAPLGINTMNVKNQWAFSKDISKFIKKPLAPKTIAYGENKRVYVNREGYYKIAIAKNDTLAFIPEPYLYKAPKYWTGFTHSQTIDIELEPQAEQVLQDFRKKDSSFFKLYKDFLKNVNPDSLVTISGAVYKANTIKALENIYILQPFSTNTIGAAPFHFTDQYGQFSIQTPKNSHIIITNMSSSGPIIFTAKNDTTVNFYL